jgi:DNA-binding CsgD family transcriptional regulator/G:T-mismatch repair DNA endonuclease (very short patch repair protein)
MSKKYPILNDYDWLYTKYIKEELSTVKIARIVGCNAKTVYRELTKKSIPIRSQSEAGLKAKALTRVQNYPLLEDYDWLYQKYRIERMTCEELAAILGCSHETVLRALRRLDIPIYANGESKIGKNEWSEERKEAFSGKNHPMYGKHHTDETKKELSRTRKELYNNPEFAKKMLKAFAIRPTKPEKLCRAILDKNNLPYKYVGDGAVVIGRKCPDFIHLNKKIVIEVFGKAFHSPLFTFKKSMPYHQTYDGTMEHYKKHGYKCVIIWDRDLEREDAEEFVLTLLKKAGII